MEYDDVTAKLKRRNLAYNTQKPLTNTPQQSKSAIRAHRRAANQTRQVYIPWKTSTNTMSRK